MASLLSEERSELIITRERILMEVLQCYENDDQLPFRRLHVTFVGERGDDQGGLTKDLFTSPWSEIMLNFFIGESAMIPYLPTHEHVTKRRFFKTIGQILGHTAAHLSYIPARLSRSMLLCIALDSTQVTDDLLLDDLRYGMQHYVNNFGRNCFALVLMGQGYKNSRQLSGKSNIIIYFQ